MDSAITMIAPLLQGARFDFENYARARFQTRCEYPVFLGLHHGFCPWTPVITRFQTRCEYPVFLGFTMLLGLKS
jgi:hypothetical protein